MTIKENLNIYEEERPGGFFRRFTDNVVSTVKIINIKPNEELSLQSHNNREEFWHIIKGGGVFSSEYTSRIAYKDCGELTDDDFNLNTGLMGIFIKNFLLK